MAAGGRRRTVQCLPACVRARRRCGGGAFRLCVCLCVAPYLRRLANANQSTSPPCRLAAQSQHPPNSCLSHLREPRPRLFPITPIPLCAAAGCTARLPHAPERLLFEQRNQRRDDVEVFDACRAARARQAGFARQAGWAPGSPMAAHGATARNAPGPACPNTGARARANVAWKALSHRGRRLSDRNYIKSGCLR